MKRDNKGFSLIELIIIIAILAILVGTVGANLGLIKKYNAKECRQMIYSSLESGRLISLSKSGGGTTTEDTQTFLSFFYNPSDGCNYYAVVVEGEVTDIKKISKNGVKIYFGASNEAASASSITGFTCLTTYSLGTMPKNMTINKITEDLTNEIIDNGYRIAYNRATGGFLKDGSGNINLSIYAVAGKYYYPVYLYPGTGKIKVGNVIYG